MCWVSSLRQVLRRQDEFRAGMRGWAEDADAWSSTCAILYQNGCHFGHLQVYKWKPEAVARAQGHGLVIKGCFSLFRSLTKSEERQLTRERWQGSTGWMIQRHWLTHKVSHLSPGYFHAVEWVKLLCFSVCEAWSQLLDHWRSHNNCHMAAYCVACLRMQRSRLFRYTENLFARSLSLKTPKFKGKKTFNSAMWPNFGSWRLTGQLGIPEWTFDIPMISLELKMTSAMTLGFVSLASALYNDVPKAGV